MAPQAPESSLDAPLLASDVVITNKKTDEEFVQKKLPWYRSGGLHITLNGMALNIFIPITHLARQLPGEWSTYYLYLTLFCIASSLITSRTIYCILIVPNYMVSLLLVLNLKHSALLLLISLALSMTKVNICMSVCLHRYAAHAAFRCGPVTNFLVCALGCLANQGGPIWWASQHRTHHKYCDVPRDPHSAVLVGKEKAFGFFHHNVEVVEEFAPVQLETTPLRILDTWSWLLVGGELYAAYYLFGDAGLFCSFTSGWLCQAITCWFNIVNHPPHEEKECKAADLSDGKQWLRSWYLPFHILDTLHPLFGVFVMEGEHKHHHANAMLAKRSKNDVAYWGFVKPLEIMGLIWNVQCGEY